MLYIGFSPRRSERLHSSAKDYPMTYLDVVFRYGAAPGENELRAIDGMREVYGIRRVQFNEQERTVRVEFDASRLKSDAVARLLRQAGVDARERLELA
jgi:chromosome condensin MukBEF ATPase and DNA-binding subunit MukB